MTSREQYRTALEAAIRRLHVAGYTDFYVHGNRVSIGCLALGDDKIEELFPLVAAVGLKNSRIWIAPCDLRVASAPTPHADDPWVTQLYQRLTLALKPFRR